MLLLGSLNGMFCGSQAKAGLVNSNKNQWGFGKLPTGSYLRGTQGDSPGRLERVH